MILGLSLDPKELIDSLSPYGEIGLWLIIFAETGLLIGFFLPGDSLLFTAGLLASQGHLDIALVVIGCFIAAVIGDRGRLHDRRSASVRDCSARDDSRFFKQEYVERTKDFFDRHGPEDDRARALRSDRPHLHAGDGGRRLDAPPHVHPLQRGRRAHLDGRRHDARLRRSPT